MSIFITLLLAIVQGITEFLPVSSSAHLLLVPWFLQVADPGVGFDAAIHVGTALALIVFFAGDFMKLLRDRDRLFWLIIVATIPGGVVGFLGDKWIDTYLHQSSFAPLTVGIGLIVFAGVLYLSDRWGKLNQKLDQISNNQALGIGFAQALALIPGVSRSGITMSAGLWFGLKREDAARFSFLLATPISIGAGVYKLYDLVKHPVSGLTNFDIALGIIISALVGLAVIKWMLDYIRRHDFMIFVWYRVLLGLIVISAWWVRK